MAVSSQRAVLLLGFGCLILLLGPAEAGQITLARDQDKFMGDRMENMIITSLNNCPLCREKEPCLLQCKQVEKKTWGECLNRCLGDNPLLLETFTSIVKMSSAKPLQGFGS